MFNYEGPLFLEKQHAASAAGKVLLALDGIYDTTVTA
jgi:hypothetical protein